MCACVGARALSPRGDGRCRAWQDLAGVRRVVEQLVAHRAAGTYRFDPTKEARAKAAAERKKREEGKRKAYEARMVRKAKREGRDPLFYLSAAAVAPPTVHDVAMVARLGEAAKEKGGEKAGADAASAVQLAVWRARWPQHCFAHHLGGVAGCPRDRSCAFLHSEPAIPDDGEGSGGGGGDYKVGGGGASGGGAGRRYDEAPSWLEENGG